MIHHKFFTSATIKTYKDNISAWKVGFFVGVAIDIKDMYKEKKSSGA